MGNEPGRGREFENVKKMFFWRKELKVLLQTNDLEVVDVQNELVFDSNELRLRSRRGQKPPYVWLEAQFAGQKGLPASLTGGKDLMTENGVVTGVAWKGGVQPRRLRDRDRLGL